MIARLVFLLLFVFSAAAQAQSGVRTIQFLHSKLVQPGENVPLTGPTGFAYYSETFPYMVPGGYWLGIIDASLGSKYTDGSAGGDGVARASMLVVHSVLSVPDNVGIVSFRVPLVLPPGAWLNASIINNDGQPQWMNSVITGILVPALPGSNYDTAFSFLFDRLK